MTRSAHTIQQTRVNLKNLKVADFASDETLCFSATVMFDNQPIAHASNEGRGGCTALHPRRGAEARFAEAEAFAKSLPSDELGVEDSHGARAVSIPITLDYLVDCIASQMHEDRRIRAAFNRDIASKVLFIKDNQLRYLKGVKLKAVADKAALFKHLREKKGANVILTELPQEEAFALWLKYAVDGNES